MLSPELQKRIDLIADVAELLEILDEMVIDATCAEASLVNNSGAQAQVECLLAYGYTEQELLERLKIDGEEKEI